MKFVEIDKKLDDVTVVEELDEGESNFAFLVRKRELTAKEALQLAEAAFNLYAEILESIAEHCGPCLECEEEYCGDNISSNDFKIPHEFLADAGIRDGAVLSIIPNMEEKTITIRECEDEFNLGHISELMKASLENEGVCFGKLSLLLNENAIVYGDD